MFQFVIGLCDRRPRKSVCLHDVGASLEILTMNFLDDVWPSKTQQIVIPFQFDLDLRQRVITKILLHQLVLLDHCSHGPV